VLHLDPEHESDRARSFRGVSSPSAADFVCGSPFRFPTIRNYLLNAPALRVRPGVP
jgi:hypothetical protein